MEELRRFSNEDDVTYELQRWQMLEQLIRHLPGGSAAPSTLTAVLHQAGRIVDACRVQLQASVGGQPLQVEWQAPEWEGSQETLWELSHRLDGGGWVCWQGQGENPGVSTRARATVVTALLSIALDNLEQAQIKHAERQLSRSLRRISSEVLLSTLDMEDVLALILDQLAELVAYDSANVMLLEDGLLQMHAARGYDAYTGPIELSTIVFDPLRTPLIEETLTGNQAVILDDTQKLDNWIWVPCGRHIRSWMGVPLRVKDQVIGLFSLDKATPGYFTREHGELVLALAPQAALALDNARMFAEIREAKEQLQGFSAKMLSALEQERSRIARELHDHAGQALLALRAELQVLKHYLPSGADQALRQIEHMDGIVLETSRDLRQLAHDLRPPLLSELGLIPALEQYVEDFASRQQIGVVFEVQEHQPGLRLPEAIELVVYRVVQEALTNLARHSQASQVNIRLKLNSGWLQMNVLDNGIGFNLRNQARLSGFGLVGMRERVAAVGGEFKIWSRPGQGARLFIRIPLRETRTGGEAP
jgi:signal transduction histidine kinase